MQKWGYNEDGQTVCECGGEQWNTAGAKTIKKNTNSTQNKSQTHRAKQCEVTSFLSTDCDLSTETCSKNVYSLGPWSAPSCQNTALVNTSKSSTSELDAVSSTGQE